ncbi:hypothetical protein Zmor_019909 [Zophobas morio]|uniref:Ionotropic glutamate receptor C-terminal domain-containing protein n=1 Tax=Zophobas morio TaxID=2755281 RepID=A0AA38I0N7_9CUCU|nr:hypothetical protein Zmor_019909 [Zophobas morio]
MLLLNSYTNVLVNLILRSYFDDHRCLLIFTDTDLDYDGHIPAVRIKIADGWVDYGLIFHYHGCQGVVIYSQNPQTIFVEFETQIRLKMERFNRRRFLIITYNPTTKIEPEFFALKELEFVSDLLLVLPDTGDNITTFALKTHKYVGTSNNNEPVLLDKWFTQNQSFLFGANLYPDKLSNQLGRPLKMATFTYEPYSVIGQKVDNHYGSELVSGVQFGLKYNMTPIPIVNEKDYWGEIFSNWSGNGLLGNLVEDNADIGFSALYTWEICYHYLDLSKPLVRTGITCLVPAPKLAARWLTPLFSYAPELWLYIIIVFIASILILSLILLWYHHKSDKKPEKYPHFVALAVKIVLKPVLLQALNKNEIPLDVASKFMLALMLVFSLFLTSTYSSGLATVMTLPRYEDSIDTVKDFADSGLDWGATQDAWITSIQNAEEPIYVQIVSKFHPTPEDELHRLSKTGQFAFSIERLPFENFAVGEYIDEDTIGNFHLMEEDFYWEQCVIMLRKNSVLLPSLDLFVLRIFEAGLISKWQNTAVEMSMNTEVQRVVKYYKYHIIEHEVVKLKWSHVEGTFAILALGCTVSLVVFVVELMFQREK